MLVLSVLVLCVRAFFLFVNTYLTGAPLLWAGFSRTVTVLSVWFRDVSWSYAGMDGAEDRSMKTVTS